MGNQQNQSQNSKIDQSKLESILREGGSKFTNQQSANSFLQQHGLSSQFKDDNTVEIMEGSNRVATINYDQQKSGSDRSIKNISY